MGLQNVIQETISDEVERLLKKNLASGKASDDAKVQTLRDIGHIMFADCKRALGNIDRFLSPGQEKEWWFDLGELLADDKNVRSRVEGETMRRALQINTRREKLISSTGKKIANYLADPRQDTGTNINEEISIFQSNFCSKDWWGALGSFAFTVAPLRATNDNRIFVQLSGENEYKWHAGENRVTKRIHELAEELVEKKRAANFMMRAKPRTFVFNTSLRQLLVYVEQINPRDRVAEMDFRIDAGTVSRWLGNR